jgi:hypothetical protein
MRARNRRTINKLLLWAPPTACGAVATIFSLALVAASIWPDVKSTIELTFFWLKILVESSWFLFGFPIFLLLWAAAYFRTRENDDASIEGDSVQKGLAMPPEDNRKGIFNDAPNYGFQTFNEAPRKRLTPTQLFGQIEVLAGTGVTIQVRIYGQDFEMQSFGRDLASVFANAGLNVILFDGDYGTRYLKGVAVEPAPNSVSRDAATKIANGLSAGGLSVSLADGPEVWKDQEFVRIGIGGNE